MSLNLKQHNDIEIEILRTIPEDKREEFIERYGKPMRDIIDTFEEERAKEEMENLKKGYLGL